MKRFITSVSWTLSTPSSMEEHRLLFDSLPGAFGGCVRMGYTRNDGEYGLGGLTIHSLMIPYDVFRELIINTARELEDPDLEGR